MDTLAFYFRHIYLHSLNRCSELFRSVYIIGLIKSLAYILLYASGLTKYDINVWELWFWFCCCSVNEIDLITNQLSTLTRQTMVWHKKETSVLWIVSVPKSYCMYTREILWNWACPACHFMCLFIKSPIFVYLPFGLTITYR